MEKTIEKISGKYAGSLKGQEQSIAQYNETQFFRTLQAFSYFNFRASHDMADGRVENFDISEPTYAYQYLACQSARFGTKVKTSTNGEGVMTTPEYNAWTSWWGDYIDSMSQEQYDEFSEKERLGQDISSYRPQGTLRGYIQRVQNERKPSITLVRNYIKSYQSTYGKAPEENVSQLSKWDLKMKYYRLKHPSSK